VNKIHLTPDELKCDSNGWKWRKRLNVWVKWKKSNLGYLGAKILFLSFNFLLFIFTIHEWYFYEAAATEYLSEVTEVRCWVWTEFYLLELAIRKFCKTNCFHILHPHRICLFNNIINSNWCFLLTFYFAKTSSWLMAASLVNSENQLSKNTACT